MGAMLAKEEVAKAFTPGSHASTFGGTPLVATAAITVIKTLLDEGVLNSCQKVGQYFKNQLLNLKSKYSFIREVRGEGLLIGLDLTCDGTSIVDDCMKRGFLINCTQGHILRFVPPLIVKEKDIDGLIACLDGLFQEMTANAS